MNKRAQKGGWRKAERHTIYPNQTGHRQVLLAVSTKKCKAEMHKDQTSRPAHLLTVQRQQTVRQQVGDKQIQDGQGSKDGM